MNDNLEVLRGLEKEWQEYVDKHDGGYSHVEGVKKCLSELRAALAAMGGEQWWRPIETAPRDGTEVFVYVRGESLYPTVAHYDTPEYFEKEYGDRDYMEEGWRWSFGYPRDFHEETIEPTHWMPLPPPPGGKVGG